MEAAVVSASQGAVRILLGKLGNVLATEYALLSGVRGEIQELKEELESMTACLRDLADGDDHNEQERVWMKQVREVAYDVEDCMDSFCHHLSEHPGDRRGLASYLRRMINFLRTVRVRHNLAADIQSLKSRAQKVSKRRLSRRNRDNAAGAPSSSRSSEALGSSSYLDNLDRWLPALHSNGSGLVGMSGATDRVVQFLEQGNAAPLRVVSIVGFGGLGKTTLATTVYNSPEVHGVQCRAFVSVSQTYDLRSLLESVLKQTVVLPVLSADAPQRDDKDDPLRGIKTWNIPELVAKSRQHLAHKRYLIVLDDVWQAAVWEKLKTAFPDDGTASRIVITTRSREVARNCSTSSNDRMYEMEPLPQRDSERLFFKTVFESDECLDDLKHVSMTILERCKGLPLAIVSIGRMLARRQNKTPSAWQAVCNSLGSELETNTTLEGMKRILTLSYNDLPYNLKACFLYLSTFPEDYDIRRGPLVRRWAAEGFVIGRHELSLEQIAHSYFDEFVSRNVVTPGQITSTGEIRSCKVHDIMLEVITPKSVQENFISFLGSSQYNTEGHDKIRRLSIHPGGTEEKKTFSSRNLTHARSLTILGSTEKPLPITFTDLTLLRVLDLEGCSWLSNQDLKDICKLSLLRYLSLRSTQISQLPDAVGKLTELVTLDVRETSVKKMPTTITRLQNLKHLLAGRYIYYTRTRSVKHFAWSDGVMLPPGLKNMSALQRISYMEISTSLRAMRELGELCQLTRLCAVNEGDPERWVPFAKSLNKLSNSLRYLSVIQRGTGQLEFLADLDSPPLFLQSLHLVGGMLPPWVSSLSNLASVSLRGNHLDHHSIEVLEKIPNLLSLKLHANAYVGNGLCFQPGGFPRLKRLVVDNLRNLDGLSFDGGAPNLEMLTLAFRTVREGGISGIGSLLKLREIEFFSKIIDSVFEDLIAAAKNHPNRPRVTRDDRPLEAV